MNTVNVATSIGEDDDDVYGDFEEYEELPFTSTFSHLEVEEGEYDKCRQVTYSATCP